MLAILHLLVMLVADIFKSRRRLEAKNLFLRHQLNIAERRLVFGCTVRSCPASSGGKVGRGCV
jgi:hypothetical protein